MAETSLDERLRELVAPLQAERDQLQASLASLNREQAKVDKEFKEKRARVRGDIGKIDRAIKPLTGEDKAAKNRRSRKHKQWPGISSERVKVIQDAIQELVRETGSDIVTIPQLAEKLGLNAAVVRNGVETLRRQEVLMKGTRAPMTSKGQPPIEYKFMGVKAHA